MYYWDLTYLYPEVKFKNLIQDAYAPDNFKSNIKTLLKKMLDTTV